MRQIIWYNECCHVGLMLSCWLDSVAMFIWYCCFLGLITLAVLCNVHLEHTQRLAECIMWYNKQCCPFTIYGRSIAMFMEVGIIWSVAICLIFIEKRPTGKQYYFCLSILFSCHLVSAEIVICTYRPCNMQLLS